MSFSDSLRSARERRGLTQQQVADAMGLDKSTYCGYETGKRSPDVQKLKKLSSILGVSGDILLETGFDVPSAENGPANQKVDEAALDNELISRLCQLTPDELEKVDAFVQGLLAAR